MARRRHFGWVLHWSFSTVRQLPANLAILVLHPVATRGHVLWLRPSGRVVPAGCMSSLRKLWMVAGRSSLPTPFWTRASISTSDLAHRATGRDGFGPTCALSVDIAYVNISYDQVSCQRSPHRPHNRVCLLAAVFGCVSRPGAMFVQGEGGDHDG